MAKKFSVDDIRKLLEDPAAAEAIPLPHLMELVEWARKLPRGKTAFPPTPGDMAALLTAKDPYPYVIPPHLRVINDKLRDAVEGKGLRRLLVSTPPRHGKEVADSVPVLTPQGFKLHGDLRVGDEVFSPSGKPVTVLDVFPPSLEKLLVTFTDGSEIICHPKHEWLVYDRSVHDWVVLETQEMAEYKLWSGGRAKYSVPNIAPLEFPERDLPVDPYTLGVWLGDGVSTSTVVCGDAADLEKILGYVPYKLGSRWVHKTTRVVYQYIKGGLSGALWSLGLKNNKHIPEVYQLGSVEQRRALLAGLVDTDGSMDAGTQRVRFVSSSLVLAKDVKRLVRSLGYRVGLYERAVKPRDRNIKDKLTCYEVAWNPHDGGGGGRALARKIPTRKFLPRRIGIRSIVQTPDQLGRCISVSSGDGLYLVGEGLLPTHNSETISKWLPFWFLCRHPDKKVMFATYEADLAAQWGRRVRDLVVEYGPKYGLYLSGDTTAANRWTLKSGGGMEAVGAMGPLTGKGAHLLIIDDPIKNSEEANSEVMREKMWEWFWTTAWTRLEPGSSVIMVATRWHIDDLIGRLEKQSLDGILEWDVIKFPALAEEDDPLGREVGQPLWPDRITPEMLEAAKKGMTPTAWSSLYQQNPIPGDGSGVKREWWKFYHAGVPQEMDVYIQSWDLAFKDLADSDYTVGQLWGRKGIELFLLDQKRERMNAPEVIHAIRNISQIHPKARMKLIEDKANGPAVIAMLQREVAGIVPVKVKGSKDARLEAVLPYIAAGNVYLPGKKNLAGKWEPAYPWVADFIEECAAFPHGTHDDQLDAMTQAISHLEVAGWATLHKAMKEAKEGPPPKDQIEQQTRDFSRLVKKDIKIFTKKLARQTGNLTQPNSRKLW